jgi:predicted nucleic acid-binding protein
MKPTVYVETTVIGYLTSWPRQDVTVAGHQQTTRLWWRTAFDRFKLVASRLVVQECSAGDKEAAKDRLESIAKLSILPTTAEAEQLAEDLVRGHAVPKTEPEDALHIALAAAHGIQYLVTWNCCHIANASIRVTIERICREAGYEPPVICTPEELLEA